MVGPPQGLRKVRGRRPTKRTYACTIYLQAFISLGNLYSTIRPKLMAGPPGFKENWGRRPSKRTDAFTSTKRTDAFILYLQAFDNLASLYSTIHPQLMAGLLQGSKRDWGRRPTKRTDAFALHLQVFIRRASLYSTTRPQM